MIFLSSSLFVYKFYKSRTKLRRSILPISIYLQPRRIRISFQFTVNANKEPRRTITYNRSACQIAKTTILWTNAIAERPIFRTEVSHGIRIEIITLLYLIYVYNLMYIGSIDIYTSQWVYRY